MGLAVGVMEDFTGVPWNNPTVIVLIEPEWLSNPFSGLDGIPLGTLSTNPFLLDGGRFGWG